jgi:hypothetical protein
MERKIMGRNSRNDRINTGIKKCHRTGELQLYAPYIRREMNCSVAVIDESPF